MRSGNAEDHDGNFYMYRSIEVNLGYIHTASWFIAGASDADGQARWNMCDEAASRENKISVG